MKKVLLITALVFGLGVAGLAVPFSGSWETDVTVTTPQTPTFELESVLKVDYTIGGWTFGSVSRLKSADGWDRQDFSADGAIGAFEFTNLLRFVPATPAFTFLRSTAAVSIAGVDLSSRFQLVGPGDAINVLRYWWDADAEEWEWRVGLWTPPDGSGIRLGFSAQVPIEEQIFAERELTFAAGLYLGSYAFDTDWGVIDWPTHLFEFQGIDFDITMPFYSTTLTIDVDFVGEHWVLEAVEGMDDVYRFDVVEGGFQDITFTVPKFPLGIPGFTLCLEVEYTLKKKTVTVTPAVAVADWAHFEPVISVDGLIAGLTIEGIRLTWDVTDAVRFRYAWDSNPVNYPGVPLAEVIPGGHQQMVELRYLEAPITLTMAGTWLAGDMPMFPQNIDIDLALADVLPGFAVRTGVDFRGTAFHAISFGFTVTW